MRQRTYACRLDAVVSIPWALEILDIEYACMHGRGCRSPRKDPASQKNQSPGEGAVSVVCETRDPIIQLKKAPEKKKEMEKDRPIF